MGFLISLGLDVIGFVVGLWVVLVVAAMIIGAVGKFLGFIFSTPARLARASREAAEKRAQKKRDKEWDDALAREKENKRAFYHNVQMYPDHYFDKIFPGRDMTLYNLMDVVEAAADLKAAL